MNSIFYSFFLIVLFSSACKLNLNNPSDPYSRDFFLTNVMRSFLSFDPCPNFQTWKKTYGTGTSKTTGSDLIILSNGDYLVSGVTRQYIISGSPVGVTNNFAGTNGTTLNTFLMRVSKDNGDILWVDYMGEAVAEKYYKPNLHKYSNGDISVAFIVTGASQPSPLNAKSGIGIPAVFVGRIREDGSRVWYTYFDSPSVGQTIVSALDPSNRLHVFVEIIANSGHASFESGNMLLNATLGDISDTDTIHLSVNENGFMIFQSYLTSIGFDDVFGAKANANGLFVTGNATQSIDGTVAHPDPGLPVPFLFKLSETDETVVWSRYLGIPAEGGYGDPNRILLKDDQIFYVGSARYSYGSPVEPTVAPDGSIKHFLFSKFNTNGDNVWTSFLGSTSESIVEFSESDPLYLSSSQVLFRAHASEVSNRFSSTPNLVTDNASGDYPIADVFLNPITGEFNRFHYQSNLTSPSQEKTEVMREVCTGKLVRLNYTKFTSSNSPEETQISIETVSVP
ncbi:hypothetical protein LEP1GSC202_0623 [Leptospira yanagawae serovar Saopaulo str. Sao Paulo = ATCC 700523]|uniref:Lipoprotein n=1 Tax=Leptospira yanagawae serovar Saopaulo str. Sao Paulo = ATCC 700523 TaxID=1249483 RepID=A0A5E8HFS8_9LEPT|nr:hypothetical protein [Leptospira yanagawae]EOQ90114.1 hypothetical protein LEP1GSC202_0623 [Leptospira yanagawae serovar Saopaulo str. Sao Paulo = ATCC 700523]